MPPNFRVILLWKVIGTLLHDDFEAEYNQLLCNVLMEAIFECINSI